MFSLILIRYYNCNSYLITVFIMYGLTIWKLKPSFLIKQKGRNSYSFTLCEYVNVACLIKNLTSQQLDKIRLGGRGKPGMPGQWKADSGELKADAERRKMDMPYWVKVISHMSKNRYEIWVNINVRVS